MERQTQPMTPETMNVLFDALAAVVVSISQAVPPEQRQAIAGNLAKLASVAERRGNTALETALMDLYAAAR